MDSLTISAGASKQLRVTETDSFGDPIHDSGAVWHSDRGELVFAETGNMDATGEVVTLSALHAGSATVTITASSNPGLVKAITVTMVPGQATSINVEEV